MVASMVAVATICAPAPSTTHGQKIAGGVGSGSPVAISTPPRRTMANGKPNRKRTWVAPTVPSAVVSSRCMALRAVWPAAASSVKGIQSKFAANMAPRSQRHARPCAGHPRLLASIKAWMAGQKGVCVRLRRTMPGHDGASPMTEIKRIGFIGIGNMGVPMAANLIRAGYDVTVHDIAAERMAAFVKSHGGQRRCIAVRARRQLRSGHHHAAERPRGAPRAAGGRRRRTCRQHAAPAASSST